MTIDEAIKHAEEVAEEQVKLCKRYDDASGYSRSHNENIRTADAKRCDKCAEEHRQLAEWLKDYKRLLEQQSSEDCINRKELYNALYEHFHDEDAPNNITEVRLGTVRNFVKDFPSATPTRNKGKWEYDAYKDRNGGHCNQCGHSMRYGAKTKFCPDCGAEMESE